MRFHTFHLCAFVNIYIMRAYVCVCVCYIGYGAYFEFHVGRLNEAGLLEFISGRALCSLISRKTIIRVRHERT